MKFKTLAYIIIIASAIVVSGCDKTPKPKGPSNGNKPTKEL